MLSTIRKDGFLPGRLCADWTPGASWACLTGNAQIASCWFLLAKATGNEQFHTAAVAATRAVRQTLWLDGPLDCRGGVQGSYPVDGEYARYQYLNWAAKFYLDAQLHELDARP